MKGRQERGRRGGGGWRWEPSQHSPSPLPTHTHRTPLSTPVSLIHNRNQCVAQTPITEPDFHVSEKNHSAAACCPAVCSRWCSLVSRPATAPALVLGGPQRAGILNAIASARSASAPSLRAGPCRAEQAEEQRAHRSRVGHTLARESGGRPIRRSAGGTHRPSPGQQTWLLGKKRVALLSHTPP